jgi:hypothetical protein
MNVQEYKSKNGKKGEGSKNSQSLIPLSPSPQMSQTVFGPVVENIFFIILRKVTSK